MSSAPSGCERLLSPRRGVGVCPRCLNLADDGGLCRACGENERHLAAVLPISYSIGGEWLHRLIAAYKRDADPWVPDAIRTLAGILGVFLAEHERCVAAAADVPAFELVTTIPSADPLRDLHHPLRRIVGELVEPTRDRFERLLLRSGLSPAIPRVFDPARYQAARRLHGETVLLIDDMWTSGASAESAAGALLAAGARTVAAIVIARHLNRGWHENDARLRQFPDQRFDPALCALCAGARRTAS